MPACERTRSNGRTRVHGVVPILEARPGGAAQRFAASMEGKHPAAVFFAAVLAGYVVLASLAVLLGVLVTDVLVHTGGIGRADESAVESLVRQRTGFLTDVSSVGSTLGGAPVLPILVVLIGIACAVQRKWRIASFAVLVLLLTSAFPARRWRVAAWMIALLLPVFVAFSRMYRGMHHSLDVGAGALIGIGAVVVLLFACRAAGVAAPVRAPARGGARHLLRRPIPS